MLVLAENECFTESSGRNRSSCWQESACQDFSAVYRAQTGDADVARRNHSIVLPSFPTLLIGVSFKRAIVKTNQCLDATVEIQSATVYYCCSLPRMPYPVKVRTGWTWKELYIYTDTMNSKRLLLFPGSVKQYVLWSVVKQVFG